VHQPKLPVRHAHDEQQAEAAQLALLPNVELFFSSSSSLSTEFVLLYALPNTHSEIVLRNSDRSGLFVRHSPIRGNGNERALAFVAKALQICNM